MSGPRSPWTTPAAWRTYASAALWLGGTGISLLTGEPDVGGWLQLRLDAAGVILLAGALVGGWNFFPKGVRAVRRLRLDMNFLMTLAIIGALLIGEPIEAAAIAALFSFAELLEAAAVTRARRSIETLVRLAPERARVVGADGNETDVPAAELRTGQRVRVRPGEKVPIDGRVVDGESAVDEATVTGESVPVPKKPGDPVYAGTLAVEGFIEIEATTDAGNTTLDRIVRLVRQAESRRAPIEHFVQRFALYYTPAVTGLAVLTMIVPPALGWGAGLEWFVRGLTLLVVACPCALVIATPVTVVSALTSAAHHGVLVKGGEYLEALGRTCAMAFDKTGSLTRGRLVVTDVESLDGTSPDDMLALAVAVEHRSEHPIARAIVAAGEARGVANDARREVSAFEARPGRGVVARVDGEELVIGVPALFPGTTLPDRFGELQAEGKTAVLVGSGAGIRGVIALVDAVRPEAAGVIGRLRHLGVHELIMLTGDQEQVARRIARDLGIPEVRAGLLPEEKVQAVEDLKRRHHTVAMLGDGVNDAPALATASVGIAMGAAGSPATIETADVALMADDLTKLPYAVRLARRARRLVRFNIALAIGLKVVLAAGAVAGVVSLMVAVLVGDMGASIAVTLSAMRLARLTPDALS
jgi:Cd2+/Zn2+-exporting ATPase